MTIEFRCLGEESQLLTDQRNEFDKDIDPEIDQELTHSIS
jgi:hypothetical protein